MPPSSHNLVPDRDCGACTACCSELTIESAELKKVQGLLCPHCLAGNGCAIYQTRPVVCREFHCQWRRYAWLDDSWRPDRSRIMLRATDDAVPSGYASPVGVVFDLLGPCEILLQPRVIEVVARMIDARIAVFLSVPASPGYASGRVLLNPWLDDAVRRRDGDALGAGLVEAFLRSVLHPKQAIAL
jgi:hypothetical protein